MEPVRLNAVAGVAVLCVTAALPVVASSDLPHEQKGFNESGYALSQYENINLANGNLTFHVPLHTVRTDGGLEYPVVA